MIQNTIDSEIEFIKDYELHKEKIKRHIEKKSVETNHWGYVGDLGYVNEKIDEVTSVFYLLSNLNSSFLKTYQLPYSEF